MDENLSGTWFKGSKGASISVAVRKTKDKSHWGSKERDTGWPKCFINSWLSPLPGKACPHAMWVPTGSLISAAAGMETWQPLFLHLIKKVRDQWNHWEDVKKHLGPWPMSKGVQSQGRIVPHPHGKTACCASHVVLYSKQIRSYFAEPDLVKLGNNGDMKLRILQACGI